MDDGSIIAGSFFHPFIGTLITGFVRARLFNFERRFRSIHSATDSIMTFGDIPAKYVSKELGDMKVEARGDALILRPKFYVFFKGKRRRYQESDLGTKPKLAPETRKLLHIEKMAYHGFYGSQRDLLVMLKKKVKRYVGERLLSWKEAQHIGFAPGTPIKKPFKMDVPLTYKW